MTVYSAVRSTRSLLFALGGIAADRLSSRLRAGHREVGAPLIVGGQTPVHAPDDNAIALETSTGDCRWRSGSG